jgi:hypothetical protein
MRSHAAWTVSHPARAAIPAARQAILQCREMLTKRCSFTLETTLAGHGAMSITRGAKKAGFHVFLVYVSLGDPELHIERVRLRYLREGMTSPTLISDGATYAVSGMLPKRYALRTKPWCSITPICFRRGPPVGPGAHCLESGVAASLGSAHGRSPQVASCLLEGVSGFEVGFNFFSVAPGGAEFLFAE